MVTKFSSPLNLLGQMRLGNQKNTREASAAMARHNLVDMGLSSLGPTTSNRTESEESAVPPLALTSCCVTSYYFHKLPGSRVSSGVLSLGPWMPPIVSCREGCNSVPPARGEYGQMGGGRGQPPWGGNGGQFERLVSTGCGYSGPYIRVFGRTASSPPMIGGWGSCEMATPQERNKSRRSFLDFDLPREGSATGSYYLARW